MRTPADVVAAAVALLNAEHVAQGQAQGASRAPERTREWEG
jgi:hypothetical protein